MIREGGMAFEVKYSPAAQNTLNSVSPMLRAEIERRVASIANDPALMTRTFTHGLRLWDGMAVADGKSYYVQFFFSFIPGQNFFLIRSIVATETPGPH